DIGPATIDGTGVNQSLIQLAEYHEYITCDATNIYWSDLAGTIGRARLTGDGVDPTFVSVKGNANDLAVSDSRIYWTTTATEGSEALDSTVACANLDGSGINEGLILGCYRPQGVAVGANFVY